MKLKKIEINGIWYVALEPVLDMLMDAIEKKGGKVKKRKKFVHYKDVSPIKAVVSSNGENHSAEYTKRHRRTKEEIKAVREPNIA